MNKNDIVHLLAARFGFRRYLELRTPYTGPDCAVEERRFDSVTRILYQSPISAAGVPRDSCLAQSYAIISGYGRCLCTTGTWRRHGDLRW